MITIIFNLDHETLQPKSNSGKWLEEDFYELSTLGYHSLISWTSKESDRVVFF